MRRQPLLSLFFLLAACGPEPRAAEPPTRSPAEAEAEARAAAEKGQFGLIAAATLGHIGPVDVVCRAPLWRRGTFLLEAGRFYISDVPGDDDPDVLQAQAEHAIRYNRTILEHPAFPHPDVCRLTGPGEQSSNSNSPDVLAGAEPVRVAEGPARSLHDAARRGSVPELRRWLERAAEVDAPDDFGLSALAWATLRNRPAQIEVLLDAGAKPWPARPVEEEQRPLWLAAQLSRRTAFEKMAERMDAPPQFSSFLAGQKPPEARPTRYPGAVITRPEWARRPSSEDMKRVYPEAARAKELTGQVALSCTVARDGGLVGCKVVNEDPPGRGFGEAALRLTPLFRLTPDGTLPEASVVARLIFQPPSGQQE